MFPQRCLHCNTICHINLKDLTPTDGASHTACAITFQTSACTFGMFSSPFGCADWLRFQGCLLSVSARLRVSSLAQPLDSLLRAPQSTSHYQNVGMLGESSMAHDRIAHIFSRHLGPSFCLHGYRLRDVHGWICTLIFVWHHMDRWIRTLPFPLSVTV